MGDGGISIWQLVIAILVMGYIWPVTRILHKAGFSRWWAIAMYIPLVNLFVIYVFAFVKWPAIDET
jgi:predicted PurR-regulated permease PerM